MPIPPAFCFTPALGPAMLGTRSLKEIVRIARARSLGEDELLHAATHVTIDAVGDTRELSAWQNHETIRNVCKKTTVLLVSLPMDKLYWDASLIRRSINETSDDKHGIPWSMLIDVIDLIPSIEALHIGGSTQLMTGSLAEVLENRKRWFLHEVTFCIDYDLSTTLLKHCALGVLQRVRLTSDIEKLRETTLCMPGVKHLELWHTEARVYDIAENQVNMPSTTRRTHLIVRRLCPNTHTLALMHHRSTMPPTQPWEEDDRKEWIARILEANAEDTTVVFDVIEQPVLRRLRKLAMAVPQEIAIWFNHSCMCEQAMQGEGEDEIPGAYRHLASHVRNVSVGMQRLVLDNVQGGTGLDVSWDGAGADVPARPTQLTQPMIESAFIVFH